MSFTNVPEWLNEIIMNLGKTAFIRMLVGNKMDLSKKRKVSTDEAQMLATKHNMLFQEVSAKFSTGIDDVVMQLVEKILTTPKNAEDSDWKGNVLDLNEGINADKHQSSCCCCASITNDSEEHLLSAACKPAEKHEPIDNIDFFSDNDDMDSIIEEKNEDINACIQNKKFKSPLTDLRSKNLNEKMDMNLSHNFAFCDYGIDRSLHYKMFIQIFFFALFIPVTMLLQQFCDYTIGSVLLDLDYVHHFLHLNDFLLWFSKVFCINICCAAKNKKIAGHFEKPANIILKQQKRSHVFLRAINFLTITVLWIWIFEIIFITILGTEYDTDSTLYAQHFYIFVLFIVTCLVFALQYGYQANLSTESSLNENSLAKYDLCLGVDGDFHINVLKCIMILQKKISERSEYKRRIIALLYAVFSLIATWYFIDVDLNNKSLKYYIDAVMLSVCHVLLVTGICEFFSRITSHSLKLCEDVMNNITMMLSPYYAKKYKLPLLYLQYSNNLRSWLELRGYYVYKVTDWTSRTEYFMLILSLTWMLLVAIAIFKYSFSDEVMWIEKLPWITILIWMLLDAYFIVMAVQIAMKFEKLQKKQSQFIIKQETFYINNFMVKNTSKLYTIEKFRNIHTFILQHTIIPSPFGASMVGMRWKIILGTILSAAPTAIRYLTN
eukprot:539779_1